MKEFAIYTLLRLVLLAATFGIVVGLWDVGPGTPNLPVSIVIAFVVSGVGSWYVLQRPRTALASRVEERAVRITSAFDAKRAEEDGYVDEQFDDEPGGQVDGRTDGHVTPPRPPTTTTTTEPSGPGSPGSPVRDQ